MHPLKTYTSSMHPLKTYLYAVCLRRNQSFLLSLYSQYFNIRNYIGMPYTIAIIQNQIVFLILILIQTYTKCNKVGGLQFFLSCNSKMKIEFTHKIQQKI